MKWEWCELVFSETRKSTVPKERGSRAHGPVLCHDFSGLGWRLPLHVKRDQVRRGEGNDDRDTTSAAAHPTR